MKKFTVSILFVFFSTIVLCQQATPIPYLSNKDYLKKSKNQRATGVVLLTAGSVMATIGLAMTLNNVSGIFDPNNPARHNPTTADILGYSGLVLASGSIPFFVASSKNKKKAMSLSVRNELKPRIHEKKPFHQFVPSILISVTF